MVAVVVKGTVVQQLEFGLDFERSGSRIIVGDAGSALKKFDDCCFQCCVTSPPYWGLRDYGVESQIGAEKQLDKYIQNL